MLLGLRTTIEHLSVKYTPTRQCTCRPPPLVLDYMTSFILWWVYNVNECMNSINSIIHRILPHCQQKG